MHITTSLRVMLLGCVLLCGVARADPPHAEEIGGVLAEMERAVLAGDGGAYLARVAMTDPVFAAEQRAWAADLARYVPAQFALEFDLSAMGIDGSEATGGLTMRWTMAGGAPARSVRCPARFVRTPEGWKYAGEAWKAAEDGPARVLYLDDALDRLAREVLAILPGVRAHAHEGFELEDSPLVGRVQEVKLFTSMMHLQGSIYLSYSDALSGWNEPGESIKLLASRHSAGSGMRVVLAHEYGHVATFELGDKATDMPWWVLEGVAELTAERDSRDRGHVDRMVRNWAGRGQLVDWEKLADFRGEALNHTLHVYKQGHHMLGFISERFGRSARNRWLAEMARGADLDDASRRALGLEGGFAGEGGLDELWRQSLGATQAVGAK